MPRGKATEIYSIFGQIEAAAAEFMIRSGKATRIKPEDIPPTVAVNDAGSRARFAVVIPRSHVREFNEVIDRLRA